MEAATTPQKENVEEGGAPAPPEPDRQEAAREEAKPEQQFVEYEVTVQVGRPRRLLKLALPAKVPFKALRYARNPEEASPADVYWSLEAIIGPEQMREVDESGIFTDEGEELLDRVLARLGIELGESSASGG